jgi:hypothetical protein
MSEEKAKAICVSCCVECDVTPDQEGNDIVYCAECWERRKKSKQ